MWAAPQGNSKPAIEQNLLNKPLHIKICLAVLPFFYFTFCGDFTSIYNEGQHGIWKEKGVKKRKPFLTKPWESGFWQWVYHYLEKAGSTDGAVKNVCPGCPKNFYKNFYRRIPFSRPPEAIKDTL